MYNVTREQAAIELNMSTRSIDRYIRSGKLRSKKEGKIVYIHADDIGNFWWNTRKQEVIIPQAKEKKSSFESREISTQIDNNGQENLFVIYQDLKSEIKQKDEEIKKLNQDIWRMQEVVKNSISMIEYKKSHFLLEESKNGLSQELQQVKKELEQKTKEIKEERTLNYIMIWVTCVIFIMMVILWIVKI